MSNGKKRNGLLYGRYECNIEDGAITIPWIEKNQIEKTLTYIIMEYSNQKIVQVYENSDIDDCSDEQRRVLEKNHCQLDNDDKWIVPNSVLDIFGGDNQCVWLGIGDHIELFTLNSLENINKKVDVNELKNFLSKLAF